MAISRRAFVAAPAVFATLPRNALGGGGVAAASDRIAAACVGTGAQGLRVMIDFLKEPEIQVARTREKLDGDGENLKLAEVTPANDLLHRPYREGWTL